MLPSLSAFRQCIRQCIATCRVEGREVEGLAEQLAATPDSYDALLAFSKHLDGLPHRSDWPYVEPETLPEILGECCPNRPGKPLAPITFEDAQARTRAAFLGSVCGCILGKPLEVDPTLEELRAALEPRGEWPLNDYVSKDLNLRNIHKFHPDAYHTWRETIAYVAPDDDINYTILGMINLETNGLDFSFDQLRPIWLRHQSIPFAWGSNRAVLLRASLRRWEEDFGDRGTPIDYTAWTHLSNPHAERCGALIFADAYGYACPGNPALAADLAFRAAAFTHRNTGVYSTMFVAAAIAAAYVERDPLRVSEIALQFVPQRSRFFQIVSDSLNEVRQAKDWLDGYERIHNKYKQYSHCTVYQECGTLINTLRFATSIDHGFCLQVMQGNDTDSYGATAGSILGAFFGLNHLDPRWLKPFNDDIRTSLNFFYERSLSALATRMSQLPALTLAPERFTPTASGPSTTFTDALY